MVYPIFNSYNERFENRFCLQLQHHLYYDCYFGYDPKDKMSPYIFTLPNSNIFNFKSNMYAKEFSDIAKINCLIVCLSWFKNI